MEEEKKEAPAPDAKAQAIAALKALAEGGDTQAAKALAAFEEKPAEEPAEEAKPAEGVKAAAAMASAASDLELRLRALEKEREEERKAAMFAGRPDVGGEVRKRLAELPFAQAKAILDAMPRSAFAPAAAAVVTATRGAQQVSPPQRDAATSPQKAEMDRVMGLANDSFAVVKEGPRMIFGGRVSKS